LGKTATAAEINEILEERGVPHACVDMDWLGAYAPRPEHDPFGADMAFRNLAAMWANFQAGGAQRIVVAAIIGSREDVRKYERAIPGAEVTVCRLHAPVAVLHERVRKREIGSALHWHLHRALEHVEMFEGSGVEDFTVDTEGRSVRDVALDALHGAGWLLET
jgi:hypothetical protein